MNDLDQFYDVLGRGATDRTAGHRRIAKLGLSGGMLYSDSCALTQFWVKKGEEPREYHPPVGNYRGQNVVVDFGRLTFDTLDLYGKVTAPLKIVAAAE